MYRFFILLFLFISCGKKPIDSRMSTVQFEASEGTFSAIFRPVNPRFAPYLRGGALITKIGDEFKVQINVTYASPGVHEQILHQSMSCPNLDFDDANRDVIIDEHESARILGPALLYLDHDLSQASSGDVSYPESANYTYTQQTSYSLMLSDLHRHGFEGELPIGGKAIAVYAHTPAGVVPIACGVFSFVSDQEMASNHSGRVDHPGPVELPHRNRHVTVPTRPDIPFPSDQPPTAPPPSGGWWDHMRESIGRLRHRIGSMWDHHEGPPPPGEL